MRLRIAAFSVLAVVASACASAPPPTPLIVYVTPAPTAAAATPEASSGPLISFDFSTEAGRIKGTVPESANNFCVVDSALSGAEFIRDISIETKSGAYTVKVSVVDFDGPGSDSPPYLKVETGKGFDTESWTWLQGRDDGRARWVQTNKIEFFPARAGVHSLDGYVTCRGYLPAE